MSTGLFEVNHHLLLGEKVTHPGYKILLNECFVSDLGVSAMFDVVLMDKVFFNLFLVVRPSSRILFKMLQSSLLLRFFKL